MRRRSRLSIWPHALGSSPVARRASCPRSRPRLEALECRLAPTVALTYGGNGTNLVLTETTPAVSAKVTIAETTANVLTIDLHGSHFDPSSTGAATGLAYSGNSPQTSTSATVQIANANAVTNLAATLGADMLTLGPIVDAQAGLANLSITAGTITVLGINTSQATSGNGSIDLTASGNLTVMSGVSVRSGMGTLSLAAGVHADGTGSASGTLAVQSAAVVS